jgi:hypothetical protein
VLRRLGITIVAITVLAALVGLAAGALTLATGNVMNTVQFPLWDNRDFVFVLIKASPVQGIAEFFNQPLMLIGHKASSVTDFTAALFYYPLAVLVHIALAIGIAIYLFTRPYRRPLAFAIGVLLILIVTNGVWLASCCGSSPGWLVDTSLRYYVFAAGGNPVERLQHYEMLLPYLFPLQAVLATIGAVLVLRPLLRRR